MPFPTVPNPNRIVHACDLYAGKLSIFLRSRVFASLYSPDLAPPGASQAGQLLTYDTSALVMTHKLRQNFRKADSDQIGENII